MAIRLEVGQKVTITAVPKTASGKTAAAQDVHWKIEDGSTAALALAVDQNDATIVTVYASGPGTAAVVCEADADLGDGVSEITAGVAITVVDPVATQLDLVIGEVE